MAAGAVAHTADAAVVATADLLPVEAATEADTVPAHLDIDPTRRVQLGWSGCHTTVLSLDHGVEHLNPRESQQKVYTSLLCKMERYRTCIISARAPLCLGMFCDYGGKKRGQVTKWVQSSFYTGLARHLEGSQEGRKEAKAG